MYDVRFFFEKRGRAKYISHLDLYRCFTRALKRSGLPVWYTQGFNQHVYLTFALPMSLGMEGMCEILDLRFTQEIDLALAKEKINDSLPESIRVLKIALPVKKQGEIAQADYDIALYSEKNTPAQILSLLEEYLKQDCITVTKKSKKKGGVEVDIRPYFDTIKKVEERGGSLCFSMRLPVGTALTINPSLLLNAFLEHCELDDTAVSVVRTGIFDTEGNLFA